MHDFGVPDRFEPDVMAMKVACIGEAMIELSLAPAPSTQAQVGFAGDTLNTAIYLKRAAPGLGVSYVTRLGRDAFSARMTEFIAAEGIATDGIEISETRRPGIYAITTDANGERSFTYWRDSSAARNLFQTDKGVSFKALRQYGVLYLSAITLAILPERVRSEFCDFLAVFRAGSGCVVFDSNYRPAMWPDQRTAQRVINGMWEMCDIALPSVDDEQAIFGGSEAEVLARFKGYGVTQGALKRGAKGPLPLGGDVDAGPFAPARQVIDTTAAGDSFNAGYLGAVLTGQTEAAALHAGHDLACRVVGAKGAILPR